MTTYYRTTDAQLRYLTPEQFAALQANGKAANLRLWVVDSRPVPGASQVVIDAGIVVGPVEAHETWALRDKTADELEADALSEEKAQIAAYITDLQTQLDISNAARAALTNVQRLNELEKDTRIAMKAAKFLLRQAKRAI